MKIVKLASVLMLMLVMAGSQAVKAQDTMDAAEAESRLRMVQQLIVSGNLNSGLPMLRNVLSQEVPEMAERVAFVEKLVEIRVADMLNDRAKVMAGLKEVVTLATEPDQAYACWQLGFAIAKADMAAEKASSAELLDFLSTKVAPGIGHATPHIELAKLYITVGNAAEAEAELTKAAPIIRDQVEFGTWTSAVAELAGMADEGQVSQAEMDLYKRLRKIAAPSVQAALDIVEFKALLNGGELAACREVYDRVLVMVSADTLAVLPLGYGLAAAFAKAGDMEASEAVFALADAFAESVPPSFERDKMLIEALWTNGYGDQAAALAWESAQAAEESEERNDFLVTYVQLGAARGRAAVELLANLQMIDAPADAYAELALMFSRTNNLHASLDVTESSAFPSVVSDEKATDTLIEAIRFTRMQRQMLAARQVSRCQTLASEFANASEKAMDAGDTAKAEAYANKAAVFQALAAEMKKDTK